MTCAAGSANGYPRPADSEPVCIRRAHCAGIDLHEQDALPWPEAMTQIILHQFPRTENADSGSPFCTKVHRALVLKSLDYEPRDMTSPAQLRRLNPKKKVPVLEVDGELIADSTAILRFLERKWPEPRLYPDDPVVGARVKLIEDWADESLYWHAVYLRWKISANFKRLAPKFFSFVPAPARFVIAPIVRRQVLAQLSGQGIGRLSTKEVQDNLEDHLRMFDVLVGSEPFLAGESISAADLAVFGPMQALRAPSTPEGREAIGRHPVTLSWMHRVDERTRGKHTAAVS